ncbi:MAG: MogA/MoaB family molybdenum cofactor biosynthesis protein [Candidatus Delongbacteria bacterium]|nr:MogA/MoaB family molybdenum cofactor biosynthesis protein [Candidatus Delongbacteria bacterium]MBN2835472.1 MogA/MoaB family molybdenum cofactor biosynthesis protein [Candidatus Delongbacteria bacterium]
MTVDNNKLVKIAIITLSDRAFRGDYEDKSGPKIIDYLRSHYQEKMTYDYFLLPDDETKLLEILEKVTTEDYQFVYTTGGTGISPRDITVDTVAKFSDKLLPGIMDYIRVKYGAINPNALLSRSVTAIKNNTIIFTLPGSTKAVDEYMTEILKVVDHMLKMIKGEGH